MNRLSINKVYEVTTSYYDENDNEVREVFTDRLIKREFDAEKYQEYYKMDEVIEPEYYCFTYYFENHEPVYSDDIENAVLV